MMTTWWEDTHPDSDLRVAYFSMEFGIDAQLPIYSGGLGVLAGDHLKPQSWGCRPSASVSSTAAGISRRD
jgi:glucan phosphorylase